MATITTVLQRYPYQWGDKDWRGQEEEMFQKGKEVRTVYNVLDGQILGTKETTSQFASPEAGVAADPVSGPPYLYADGKYYADAAEIFQPTAVKITSYNAFGQTSYQVTLESFDPLSGAPPLTTQFIVDGQMPLAPTQGSAQSRLVRRPAIQQLSVSPCDFVSSVQALDLPWAEDEDDMAAAGRRAMQRATAVPFQLKLPANPMIKRGDTVQVIHRARGIDWMCLVVGRHFTVDGTTGEASMELDLEWWPS